MRVAALVHGAEHQAGARILMSTLHRAGQYGRSRASWLVAGVLTTLACASPALAAPLASEATQAPTDEPAKATTTGKPAHDKVKPAKGKPKPDAAKPEAAKPEAPKSAPAVEQTPVGEDALRLGPFVPPPKPFPFPLLGDDKAKELFVDRAGNLYRERPYSGQVPDWNIAPPDIATGRCKVEPQLLTWVGFQNNADGSRVYVQLEKSACGYVYRPDDQHVVIDLPQVTVANANLKREILTGAFPTAVDFIKTEEIAGRGTRIVITLREKRPYLSAHLGRYVFVDISR
jgi:hypothetical protein